MNAPNLRVLSNGPLKPVLPGLVEIFQQSTGIQIELEFAPGPVIAGRVTDGEVADVLIIPLDETRELVDAVILLSEGCETVPVSASAYSFGPARLLPIFRARPLSSGPFLRPTPSHM